MKFLIVEPSPLPILIPLGSNIIIIIIINYYYCVYEANDSWGSSCLTTRGPYVGEVTSSPLVYNRCETRDK